MNTLHCALENGADLYVNERQNNNFIQHYRAMSVEERRKKTKNANSHFFYFAWCVRKIALYSDVIHSFHFKSAIEHDGCV